MHRHCLVCLGALWVSPMQALKREESQEELGTQSKTDLVGEMLNSKRSCAVQVASQSSMRRCCDVGDGCWSHGK